MAIQIDNPKVEQEILSLALERGQTVYDVIETAVKGLRREAGQLRPRTPDPNYVRDLKQMAAEIRAQLRPGIRSTDDLVGYDDRGLPK